jgi:hypothetical protein
MVSSIVRRSDGALEKAFHPIGAAVIGESGRVRPRCRRSETVSAAKALERGGIVLNRHFKSALPGEGRDPDGKAGCGF